MWLWLILAYCSLCWVVSLAVMWSEIGAWTNDAEFAWIFTNSSLATAAALITILTAPFWLPFALAGICSGVGDRE